MTSPVCHYLSAGPGKPTFDQLAHVPFWVLALGVAAVLAAALVALERLQPWGRTRRR